MRKRVNWFGPKFTSLKSKGSRVKNSLSIVAICLRIMSSQSITYSAAQAACQLKVFTVSSETPLLLCENMSCE